MRSALDPRARRLATLVLAALLLLAGPAALSACGGADEDPQAAACATLRGDLQVALDGTATCAVPRTAYTVETVRLHADGAVDAADAARRRTACGTGARRARARARITARRRSAGPYATVRWVAPGVCRAARATLPDGEVRALRAERLLAEARDALSVGDAASALATARRADGLTSTAASRALVVRAQAATTDEPSDRPSTSVVSPNEYLGLSCERIGHAFRVAPGSDPAHDPDGDGQACEGE